MAVFDIEYARLHSSAHDALRRMRNKIWAARKSGNVNTDVFNENRRMLEALERYFNHCSGMVMDINEYIEDSRKQSYDTGFQKGYNEGKAENFCGTPHKHFDREAHRMWSVLKLQQDMPDLF